jgi:hypothetical protein
MRAHRFTYVLKERLTLAMPMAMLPIHYHGQRSDGMNEADVRYLVEGIQGLTS